MVAQRPASNFLTSDITPNVTRWRMPEMTRRERRNTVFSRDIGDDICDLVVDGYTPQEICDGEDGRPSHFSTLYRWLETEAEFFRMYHAAWLWRVDHFSREIVRIADDDSKDYVVRKNKDDPESGDKMVFDRQNVARSKLAIETRWRMLASYFPRKFGATTMGGAAPQPTGDDAKVIEQQSAKDEIKTFTVDQMREEALNWTAPSKT